MIAALLVQSDSGEEIAYKLNSYWSDIEHILVNEEVRFMLSEQEQRHIYHLELEGQEFKELRVLIKPETRRYPFDKVKMCGSFGKDSNPTSQNNDFESFPLWEDAEGVYLFRSRTQGTDNELHLKVLEVLTVFLYPKSQSERWSGTISRSPRISSCLKKQNFLTQYSKVSKAIGQGRGWWSLKYRTAIWIGQNSTSELRSTLTR